MCNHDLGHDSRGTARRSVLLGGLAGLSALLAPRAAVATIPRTAFAPASLTAAGMPSGLTPSVHAMHLHGSGSEGAASWSQQISQALNRGIDVLWPSDHDWRVEAADPEFGTSYAFTTLTGWMTWKKQGVTTANTVDIVSVADGSPFAGRSALRAKVTTARGIASVTTLTTHDRLEGNVRGRRLSGDVLITNGALEITVNLSTHAVGPLSLTYRLGDVAAGLLVRKPQDVLISVPAPIGSWTNFDLVLLDDIRRAWPSIEAEDNSINGLTIGARASGSGAEVLLPRIDLPRDVTGATANLMHGEMLTRLGVAFPGLTIGNALEYSANGAAAHLNGFYANGPAPLLPDTYVDANTTRYPRTVAEAVHAAGGVVSLNHPAGTGELTLTDAQQSTLAISKANKLLRGRLYGVDVVELGYEVRGGLALERYLLHLGAMLWRDGWVFTATGVSDDHVGTDQSWLINPVVTRIWGASSSLADQLTGLRQGRAHVTLLPQYAGDLWLDLDGVGMGSVLLDPSTTGSRTLTVSATGLATGFTVDVYQGPVDYPGTTATSGNLQQISSLPATAYAAGAVSLTVGRDVPCYYLAVVRNAAGLIVGFTNPVWELKAKRTGRPIPAERIVKA